MLSDSLPQVFLNPLSFYIKNKLYKYKFVHVYTWTYNFNKNLANSIVPDGSEM